MISVNEALAHIEHNIQESAAIAAKLQDAYGCVLASDIHSPIHMPPFRQSAMDGYAMKLTDTNTYRVVGEVSAGASENIVLNNTEAVRIFTGGRVPDDATTVVMQEDTIKNANQIEITKTPSVGANVRPLGEQLKMGSVALKKGTVLNEARLGFLAGLGIEEVNVFHRPTVHILITGNELKQAGQTLKEGEVYDSNSVTLRFAVQKEGITDITVHHIPDTLEDTIQTISNSIKQADIVLISGGISVGDYDFVESALEADNVNPHFYKVNQKPGKPLWFGTNKSTVVFALPGNPASSLTCFYVYVLPAIRLMMGKHPVHLKRKYARADTDIVNVFSKTLFLKAIVKDDIATPLTGQASSMLKSFALANALLIVPESTSRIRAGEELEYITLRE
ncbi:molybdopterin molybdotransferase MoeA [Aquimarina sp. U1-2]|uniref:molybdopterin molybdotransferase MoeA n=1 Tax=Aquimarina sp. U1-2 TaxID=2823141 RepID=UPI001AECE8EA|nr:gephyrin-like molybdotransferase Glp [Aquimarina sp. U1-2]MBP2833789.1 molybdopterin molybdotransferase MoeA [Aquimarina sp. U1-2]